MMVRKKRLMPRGSAIRENPRPSVMGPERFPPPFPIGSRRDYPFGESGKLSRLAFQNVISARGPFA
jgi:hypothetical protein